MNSIRSGETEEILPEPALRGVCGVKEIAK